MLRLESRKMTKLAVIFTGRFYDMGGLVTPYLDNATVYPIDIAEKGLADMVKRYQRRGLDTSQLRLIEVRDYSKRDKRLRGKNVV